MVGREARTDQVGAAVSGVGKELLDHYVTYMTRMPLVLHRRSDKKLSLEACKDIAQEAFLNVARRLQSGELDEGVNIAAYLTTAAKNLASSRMRAKRRLELADEVLEPLPELADEKSGDDALEELVWPAIEAMSVSARKQVVRLQSQGLSDIEIAAALGIPAGRVHRERHKAVVELRRALGEFIRDRHRNKTWKKDR
ncbi:RNA polymerase sigma factor [Streptomyces sp. NPDC048612]|uniref:RNA polymerase sigma factor n=1 Tax=Streptomyces sp. NPDC048612 TaxID=3365579 RepID=UPI003715CA6A